MTLTADDYLASMETSLDMFAALRPRSRQTELGVSSVGHCKSDALWRMTGIESTDAPVSRQALHGTALHELWAQARAQGNPRLLLETELSITLPSGVVLKGHADEIDPDEPSVTDWKSVGSAADLTAQRRLGSSEQQRFQRHLYYYGAMQAGLVPAEGVVRNWWIDRAGQDSKGLVEQEPFSMDVVREADAWLSDVLYAAEHGEESPRDKPYQWCRDFCQFFSHCRTGVQNPDVVITDPEFVAAAELLRDGRMLAKAGADLEDHGKRVLAVFQSNAESDDISAFTAGDVRFRWTWVNRTGKGYFKVTCEDVA